MLEGSVRTRGRLDVPPIAGDPLLSLLIDTGAQTSVAGDRWKDVLSGVSGIGTSVRGVGDVLVESEGSGTLDIHFRTPEEGIWSINKILDPLWPKLKSVKLVTTDHSAPPRCLHLVPGMNTPRTLETETVSPSAAGLTGERFHRRNLRRFGGTALTDPKTIAARVGITNLKVLKDLHRIVDGVDKLIIKPGDSFLDEAVQRACKRRTTVHHARSATSLARDETIPKGKFWYIDFTPRMPLSVDNKHYGLILIEKRTRYVLIYYVQDKSSESFVLALRQLLVFARQHFPEVLPLTIHGDSDSAWTVHNRDELLPLRLAEFSLTKTPRSYDGPLPTRRLSTAPNPAWEESTC